jgi:hypothetical protein
LEIFMSYLVFDIETVPDQTLWAPVIELPRLNEEKKPGKADLAFLDNVLTRDFAKVHALDLAKALDVATRAEKPDAVAKLAPLAPPEKPEFAPLYAHRPIAIGYVLLEDNLNVRHVGCAGVTSYGDDEARLLGAWSSFVGHERPAIVTWGGRGFDMPVITLRSLRWGVQQAWYNKDYRYRYNEDRHLDLCEAMTEFGAVPKLGFKLGNIARLLGLPGKGDVDGSQVAKLFQEGRAAEIELYCQTDAIQTAFVMLRFFLMRGRVDAETYRTAAQNLLAACRGQAHLATFAAAVDEKSLLLR